MNKNIYRLEIGDIAAISTWAVVFGITLYFMSSNSLFEADIPTVAVLFVLYLLCFMSLGQPFGYEPSAKAQWLILIVMLAASYGIMLLVPLGYLAILTIIWVAVLVHFVSIKICMLVALLVIISWFGLHAWKWNMENMWLTAALYGCFHCFSILMAHQTQEAQLAKQRLERLNNELRATQDLVEQAGRQQERTRIARDLHDLIGHHLTALIINLEVAKHQTSGPAKQQVEQSHALAKLLMSDVREAITEIRANESININSLIELWRSYIPTIDIHTNIDESITWHDLTIAQTVSFCILEALTNSMRHANANNLHIDIKQLDQRLHIEVWDDGKVNGELAFGNGLSGMQERLSEVNGLLQTGIVDGHLKLSINLPMVIRHGD